MPEIDFGHELSEAIQELRAARDAKDGLTLIVAFLVGTLIGGPLWALMAGLVMWGVR